MENKVGTREEWQAAREALLEREKELTRRNDELARERLELPWVPIEKEYSFETDDGTRTLADLFKGRSQLLVYNFMFGPDYEAGCPVCSSSADTVDGAVPHLNGRDVTMLYVSRAPLEKLQAYKQRMGWTFPWVSSHGSVVPDPRRVISLPGQSATDGSFARPSARLRFTLVKGTG